MENIVLSGSINETTIILCSECLISSQKLCIHPACPFLYHAFFITWNMKVTMTEHGQCIYNLCSHFCSILKF